MPRRAVVVFFIICIFMGVVSLKLINLSTGLETTAGNVKNSRSITLSDLGAPIYDCKGRFITNSAQVHYAAVKPDSQALAALRDVVSADEFESVREKLGKGKPVAIRVLQPLSVDNIKNITVNTRYSVRQPAAHLIGYTDSDDNGVCGIEKSFESIFKNNRQSVSAVFAVDAYGNTMSGAEVTARTDGDYGESGVYLTIDLDIQKIVEECMDSCGVELGAVVVIEPKTGAIRACASRPTFEPSEPAKSLEDANSPFINRALSAFTVGSVFKPAIAVASLEQGVNPYATYECTGSIKVGNTEFGCYEHRAHGKVDMCGALEKSCNAYFINLVQNLDRQQLISTLASLGFGEKIDFCDGIGSAAGYLPDSTELDSGAAVANLAFGQGSLTATPVQMAAYMSAIANGGVYITPYLVEKAIDGETVTVEHTKKAGEHIISEQTATLVSKFLKSAVENGNGNGAKPDSTTAAGKTATAQTGKTENGQELYNTWFAGWFPAEEAQYVIAVLKERGAGGASDCAPVFKAIADKICENINMSR